MKRLIALSAALFTATVAQYANAASSDWFSTEGGEIRLVTAADPADPTRLRGALEMVLKPGWKTYWVDPGDAGVPPQIDVSASRDVSSATFLFPAPKRFDDGYAVWAGYKNHVSLAIEFENGSNPFLEADVFLGICEKICIPVSAKFSVDAETSNDSNEHIAVVDAAFSSLPRAADDTFGLQALRVVSDKSMRAEVTLPGNDGEAELFIAAANGWYFGVPVKSSDKQAFDVPVLLRPKDPSAGSEIFYTLISGEAAVSGTVPINVAETD